MSLLPYLLSELQGVPRRQQVHYYDWDDLFTPRYSPHDLLLLQRGRGPLSSALQSRNTMKNDGSEFRVNLDVQQFKPDEISVKVVDDFIVVEGKHEERQDEHGFVQRQFQRRYLLPKDVDPNGIQSSLSSDGVLMVSAPKKAVPQGAERQITIVHTNKPAIPQTEESGATPGADGDKKGGEK